MTVDAIRSRSRRRRRLDEPEPIQIGEVDSEIFDCPTCARPLATGTRRCPACSTRLVDGIRATKAAEFVLVGLLFGSLAGGGVVGAAVAVSTSMARVPTEDVPAAVASGVPVQPTGAPVASALPPVVEPALPAPAVSALRQSALLNDRLAAEGRRLTAALDASAPASADIARALRALAANAAFGDRIAPDVGSWPEAAAVSAGLVEAYARIGSTALDGLAASLNNTAAYVAAGTEMEAALASLAALDVEARDLATDAGIDLPPVASSAGDAP